MVCYFSIIYCKSHRYDHIKLGYISLNIVVQLVIKVRIYN